MVQNRLLWTPCATMLYVFEFRLVYPKCNGGPASLPPMICSAAPLSTPLEGEITMQCTNHECRQGPLHWLLSCCPSLGTPWLTSRRASFGTSWRTSFGTSSNWRRGRRAALDLCDDVQASLSIQTLRNSHLLRSLHKRHEFVAWHQPRKIIRDGSVRLP